ncbi:hypothetical protein L3Q82_007987 [Scortum barcoo]|uniref:Uncharacterized protein n=1 Tax=Scortum barcoo TaxID=214431 RepID=A0ACB8WKD9_9TELE|nr:hypothetical protein L3Q82_007987 [Scortum barcoo]
MEVGRGLGQVRRKPSIVGMKMRELQEDIVDLDSFVNQHYKVKALRLSTSSRVKQRTLQRKVEQEPGSVFGLGMELDAGLGMVGLQPIKADLELEEGQQRKRVLKRELTGRYLVEESELRQSGRWMSLLSIGFSKVDVSFETKGGALLARGPSGSHCSELFMVSTGARSRLSGDIFIHRASRPPPLLSPPLLYTLWRMLSARGGGAPLPALPLAPRQASAAVTSAPRRPCSAEWTEQPV